MHLITEASGLLASLTGFLVWLPQARRVWRDRRDRERLAGISLQTQVLALAGNVLWGVYALGIGSFWLGAPSVVNVPVTIMTITVVLRAQRATAPADAAVLTLAPVAAPTGVSAEAPPAAAPTVADLLAAADPVAVADLPPVTVLPQQRPAVEDRVLAPLAV